MEGCHILFSTQSGRSKACARRSARLVREETCVRLLNRSGQPFDDAVQDLAEFCDVLRASKSLLLLFVSTTGDGEHTDTIQRTWKLLLQKALPSDLFKGIQFSIFNLGDRAYGPNFCAAGRKLAVRLMQLGAELLGEAGYGDDGTPNGGVFADLDLWIESVLLPKLPVASNPEPSIAAPVQLPYRVKVSAEPSTATEGEEWKDVRYNQAYNDFFESVSPITAYRYINEFPKRERGSGSSQPLLGDLVVNKRLTADEWSQNTRHLRIKVPALDGGKPYNRPSTWSLEALPYQAGDVASILPSNSEQEVDRFLKVLPQNMRNMADQELTLEFDSSIETLVGVGYPFWPRRCTLRGWLKYCADLHALPEREDLRALSYFCSLRHALGTDQQLKLRSLSETSESALFADYVLREKRSWAEVLYDFDSLRAEGSLLSIGALFSLLSPIRVRDYSIASSPSEEWMLQMSQPPAVNIDLCVAVVEGTTPLGRNYHGLCSKYLAQLEESDDSTSKIPSIRLWIRPGTFQRLPLQISAPRMADPVLCIGAGTGIAPLRSLIRERVAVTQLPSTNSSSTELATGTGSDFDNILIFGCRKQSADFYYNEEWEKLHSSGQLQIMTAFSQDQWHKIYVQQILEKAEKERKLLSRHLLEQNGSVYIAGGPQMAKTVKEVIVEVLTDIVEGGEKQALLLLAKLQRQGRFCVEAWG